MFGPEDQARKAGRRQPGRIVARLQQAGEPLLAQPLQFLSERLRKIPGVRETETFVYLRLMKQSYQWGTR